MIVKLKEIYSIPKAVFGRYMRCFQSMAKYHDTFLNLLVASMSKRHLLDLILKEPCT